MFKLSVITINFNKAKGLTKTIESLINQTWNQFELIIVDGGSTDGSLEIINGHSDYITHWVSEPDNGIYHAMNKGIAKATGEYCFFLNSGDFLVDNMLFQKVFETNPSEDVLFGNLYVGIRGKVVGKAYGKKQITFSDIYSHTIKHQASFIKRNLFERAGLYNEKRKIVADWEFFIKTLGLEGASYRYIDAFIAYFDNDGLSNRNTERVNKEREEVIQENIPFMMQPDYEFLRKYKRFERLYENRLSFFLLRLLNKFMF